LKVAFRPNSSLVNKLRKIAHCHTKCYSAFCANRDLPSLLFVTFAADVMSEAKVATRSLPSSVMESVESKRCCRCCACR